MGTKYGFMYFTVKLRFDYFSIPLLGEIHPSKTLP